MNDIRPARMAALYVKPGDVIVSAPGDYAEIRVMGTVLTSQKQDDVVHMIVRSPSGATFPMRKVQHRPVWVNVPGGPA